MASLQGRDEGRKESMVGVWETGKFSDLKMRDQRNCHKTVKIFSLELLRMGSLAPSEACDSGKRFETFII